MSIPSASEFINMLQPENQRYYKLGKIDPSYTGGRPRIIFDGETTVSVKQYPYLGRYTPAANDRVLMLKIANSYVVFDKII